MHLRNDRSDQHGLLLASPSTSWRKSALLASTVLTAAALTTPACADSLWTGTTGNWTNGANWSNGVPNSATAVTGVENGGTAQITTAATAGTQVDIFGSTIDVQTGGSLSFGQNIILSTNAKLLLSGSTDVTGTAAGNAITFEGGTLSSNVTGSLTPSVVVSGTGNIQAASGTTLTLGTVSMLGAIDNFLNFGSPIAAGTIVVGPDSTTSAQINILASNAIDVLGGTVKAAAGGSLPYLLNNTPALTVASGATLDLNDQSTVGNTVSLHGLTGGGTIKTGTSAATVIAVDAGGTFAGTVAGAGNVHFQLPTHASLATTVLTGDSTYTGGTTVDPGVFLQLGNGGGTGSVVGDIVNNGGIIADHNNTFTLGGNISGAGSFQQVGTGTTVLTGINTYTGGTNVQHGTLVLGNGGTSGSIVGDVSGLGNFAINRSDAYTFGGVIGVLGTFAQLGTGTTTLTGTNTYFGGTIISNGALAVGADNNLGNAAGGITFDTNGGTLRYLAGFSSARSVTLNGVTGTFDTNGNNATLSGMIGGTGGLIKAGAGTLTLADNNSNTYTGDTTIAAGILQVGNGGMSGTLGQSGHVINNGILAFDRSDFYFVNADISGTGSLLQIGSGEATITGSASYTGNTTVSAGSVVMTQSFTNAAGATLSVANGADYSNGGSSVTNNGTITVAAGGLMSADLNNINTVTNAGTWSLSVLGNTGSITNTATGSWNGAVTSNAGTIVNNGLWNGNVTNTGGSFTNTIGASVVGTLTNTAGVVGNFGAWNNDVGNSALFVNMAGATVSGTLTNAAGTAINNGTISGDTSVNGGVVAGTGTFQNVIVNHGGTFAPGSGTPGSTATVAGNLSFSGGSYQINLNPTTSSLADVAGTATLTGGTVNAVFGSGLYTAKQYTILNAGSRVGTFSGVNAVNLTNYNASLSYSNTAVFLDLTANLGGGGSLPRDQQGVAKVVNAAFNGGTLPSGLGNLFGMSGTQLNTVLSQLSGEAATGTSTAGFQSMGQFLGVMLDPNMQNHGGEPATALGYANEPVVPAETAAAYAAVTPKDPGAFAKRWGVWGAAYGGGATFDGNATAGSHDTTARAFGSVAGAEYRFSPDAVLGFALGGGGTNWGLAQGLGGGSSDAFQGGLYGTARFGGGYVSAAAGAAEYWASTNRTVTMGTLQKLEASFQAQSYGTRLESGYRFGFATFGLTPYGALQAQEFHTPSYSEHATAGSGVSALSYNAQNTTALRTELGARFDGSVGLPATGVLVVRARAAWAHDSDTGRQINAVFQALPGGSFTVNGATPSANSALLSAGTEYIPPSGWTLAAKFDSELGSHSATYAGTGTVRYAW
jgi:fibronectin-binding autotransporter adhesin